MARKIRNCPLEKNEVAAFILWLRAQGFREPDEITSSEQGCYVKLGTTRKRGDFQGTMQTIGAPDMFISFPGSGFWKGIEMKRLKGGKVTPAQGNLQNAGKVWIVYGAENAIRVVSAFMNSMDGKA